MVESTRDSAGKKEGRWMIQVELGVCSTVIINVHEACEEKKGLLRTSKLRSSWPCGTGPQQSHPTTEIPD